MPRCPVLGRESHSLIEKMKKGLVGFVPENLDFFCWFCLLVKDIGMSLCGRSPSSVVSVSPNDVKIILF